MKWLYLTFGIFLIISVFFHPITSFNQDLGRHIVLGKIIVTTHSVPKTNLLSYTNTNFPFINSHWLSEVIFYLISLWGNNDLFIFVIAMGIAIFLATALPYVKKMPFQIYLYVLLLYILLTTERTDIRPELFSYFFTALCITILYKNREKVTKWIFLIPIITIFWVNFHIFFFLAPCLIGAFLVDTLWVDRCIDKRLLSIFVLSCLATLINPHGLTGAAYPFFIFTNYGYPVQENQPIFSQNPGIQGDLIIWVFWSICMLLLVLLVMQGKKARPIDWILFISFSFLGIFQIRNITYITFLLFPLIAYRQTQITTLLKKYKKINSGILIALITVSFSLLTAFFIDHGIGFGVDNYYQNGVDFLEKNHIHGPIFNNFDTGSYLLYRLYPQEKVFIDQRPEAYPASFLQQIDIPMGKSPSLFAEEDTKYHFNIIFYNYNINPLWLIKFLGPTVSGNTWKPIYLDNYVMILIKNIPQNQRFIQNNLISDSHLKVQHIDTNNQKELMRLYALFYFIGWQDSQIAIAKVLTNNPPTDCRILQTFSQLPNTVADFYKEKYNEKCL